MTPAGHTGAARAVVVGCLAVVEFTSGVLQGYYVPVLSDIARHLGIHDADVNWFEGTQLMLSALAMPAFAKLGDMYGHRRMLWWSAVLTAAASFLLPFAHSYWTFLTAWSLQGFYVVWLPLNIAIVWSLNKERPDAAVRTAKTAGLLVAALEAGAVCGAISSGAIVDSLPLWIVLLIPAMLTLIAAAVIAFGIEDQQRHAQGRFDLVGLALLSAALVAVAGGLSMFRANGPDFWSAGSLVALGAVLLVSLAGYELRHPDPLIDVKLLRSPALAPVFLTAGLLGVSILGAQAPLSTFVRTDPEVYGYGLGAGGLATSVLIGSLRFPPDRGGISYKE